MFIGLIVSETGEPADAKRAIMGRVSDEDWAAMQRDRIPPNMEDLPEAEFDALMAQWAVAHDKREDARFTRVAAQLALGLRSLPPFPD